MNVDEYEKELYGLEESEPNTLRDILGEYLKQPMKTTIHFSVVLVDKNHDHVFVATVNDTRKFSYLQEELLDRFVSEVDVNNDEVVFFIRV